MLPLSVKARALLAVLLAACGAPKPGPAGRGPSVPTGDPEAVSSDRSERTKSAVEPETQPEPEPEPEARAERSSEPAPPDDASVEGTPSTAAPLPRGTTILHVGDSFAGALGIDLNRELKSAGIRGVLRYQTSSYIPTWAWGKELEQYLAQTQPDLVLITLGANELEVPDPSQRIKAIERLVGRVGGRPCVWIAPPLWEGARPDLLSVIREHCAPCVYMDSSAVVPKLSRARDKIHPSMEARKIWARAVLDWLSRHRDPAGSGPWALRIDSSGTAPTSPSPRAPD